MEEAMKAMASVKVEDLTLDLDHSSNLQRWSFTKVLSPKTLCYAPRKKMVFMGAIIQALEKRR
ncbi:nucleoprotein [Bienertia sinuspersici]